MIIIKNVENSTRLNFLELGLLDKADVQNQDKNWPSLQKIHDARNISPFRS